MCPAVDPLHRNIDRILVFAPRPQDVNSSLSIHGCLIPGHDYDDENECAENMNCQLNHLEARLSSSIFGLGRGPVNWSTNVNWGSI